MIPIAGTPVANLEDLKDTEIMERVQLDVMGVLPLAIFAVQQIIGLDSVLSRRARTMKRFR